MSHRRLLVSAVATAALSFPVAAHAVENTVEFQLAASPLLTLVKDRALAIPPSCPVPFDAFGQDEIVDHITWGDPTLQREPGTTPIPFSEGTVQAHRPEIVIPLTASLKTVACVDDPACPTTDTTDIDIGLAFVLTADQNQLCATYNGTTVALPGDAQQQVDAAAASMGAMCMPLSLGSVIGLLGDGVAVNDVGVSANTALDRLAVRLELDTPDGAAGSSLSDWTTFLNGTLSDSFGGDFSLFIDNLMLRRAVGRRLTDNLGTSGDLTLTSDVTSSWQSWIPQVSLSVDADADVGAWCAIDIGLDPISFQAPLALGADGASIQMNTTIDWDTNDGDIAACVFLNPFFLFTAPVPFESFLVLEAIADGYSAANQIQGALPSTCTLVDDHHVDCNFPFALPKIDLGPGPDGVLSADLVAGTATGLTLEGSIAISGFATPARTPLTLEGYTPEYGVHGDCNSLGLGYEGYLEVGGGDGLYCDDPYSHEASPANVDDKLDAFWLTDRDSGPYDDVTVAFSGGWDPSQYWANPYPLYARVWSTVGAGTVDLGTPVYHEATLYDMMKYISALVSCIKLETGWHGIPGKFDPHWLVDPGPDDLVFKGDDVWTKYGAKATVEKMTLSPNASALYDERSGITTVPSGATLEVTMLVDGGEAGKFEFTASSKLDVELVSAGDKDLNGVMLTKATIVTFDVGRESLPRGLTFAQVPMALSPTDVAFVGQFSEKR